MKTARTVLFLLLFINFAIPLAQAQSSSKSVNEEPLVRMSLTASRPVGQDENVGDIFQSYTDKLENLREKLHLQEFKFEEKSFSVFKQDKDSCLHLSIQLSVLFVHDSKKINILYKELNENKMDQWGLSIYVYIDY